MNFQEDVRQWTNKCFGDEISNDKRERNFGFLEESIELVQSLGSTKEECLQLVEYVFGRPVGEPSQEVGGVMVTLAALCNANTMNMDTCASVEVDRIWGKLEQIREKQKNKKIKSGPIP